MVASAACSKIATSVAPPRIIGKASRNRRPLTITVRKRMTRSLMRTRPMTWNMTVMTISGRLQAQFPSQADASSMSRYKRKSPIRQRMRTGDSRFKLTRFRSTQSDRNEQPSVAALDQQRDLLVVVLHHFAQLRHRLDRRPIDGEYDVTPLNARLGRPALRLFNHES